MSGRRWSLRRRLTLRVLALVSAGWLATIALAMLSLDHELNEMFDEELQALVASTVLNLDAGETGRIARAWGIQTADGERVLRVFAQDEAAPAGPWPELDGEGFHDAPGWRILRHEAEGVVIEAAHAKSWRREEMLEASLAFLALMLPLIVLLLWGLGRVTETATAPVISLARGVAARSPDDLSPIEAEGLPNELRPLAEALSGYVTRIDTLRRSERDFIANAAHELRTPLAAIRGRLELSQDADARASVEAVDALTRRVERLLQLSRLEAGVGIGRGPSDLVRILHLLIDEQPPERRAGIVFDDGDLEAFEVSADADALAILLRNLMENALEHGSGALRLVLRADGRLTLANPVQGPAALEGNRFAPGPESQGQGLGLSIVAALAKAMAVTVRHAVSEGVVTVTLDFPIHR